MRFDPVATGGHLSRKPRHPMVMLRLCATLIVLLGSRLTAQANPDSVKMRNDCRLAEQSLQTGHPSPDRKDALTTIGLCGSSAFPVIGDLWENGALDSLEIEVLATSTRTYPSDVLAQRLLRVAESSSRPRNVRLVAMSVLVTFIDSSVVVPLEDLTRPEHVLFGSTSHPVPQVGRDRLTIPLRAQLRTLVGQLASSDGDPVIRTAAGHLFRNLR